LIRAACGGRHGLIYIGADNEILTRSIIS